MSDTFAEFTQPGKKPVVNSIFDFSAEALGEIRLWLEQNPPAIPISNILGFHQQAAIIGRVASNGAIVNGTGFSVNHLVTGAYLVVFDKPLTAVPAINVTIDDNSATNLTCKAANASTTQFQTNISNLSGTLTDAGFYFSAAPFT